MTCNICLKNRPFVSASSWVQHQLWNANISSGAKGSFYTYTRHGVGRGWAAGAFLMPVKGKNIFKTLSELPTCGITLVRSSDTRPWAWLQWCSALGLRRAWAVVGWDLESWAVMARTFSHLDISCSSRTTEPPEPSHELCSSGKCQQWLRRCVSHFTPSGAENTYLASKGLHTPKNTSKRLS